MWDSGSCIYLETCEAQSRERPTGRTKGSRAGQIERQVGTT